MSYFSEWLADGNELVRKIDNVFNTPRFLATLGEDQFMGARQETIVLKTTLEQMRHARIVRMPSEQAKIFLDMPHIPEQDFTQLHSPFPNLYIEFNPAVTIPHYDDPQDATSYQDVAVKAAMITEIDNRALDTIMAQHPELSEISFGLPQAATAKIVQICLFVPLPPHPRNTYVATFAVATDGKLIRPIKEPAESQGKGFTRELSDTCINWAIHTMNFLTSPSIVLDRKEPEESLQKARQKRGREPLPGWYEISYKKANVAPREVNEGTGSKHSFRYDVRGHMMHVKRGRMAGRVIWCPPHQRGLANELYKPKVYRLPQELPEQPTPWKG